MVYLLIGVLCGFPLAPLIFRNMDIWHAHGVWFQAGVLVCFCASLSGYYRRNEVSIKNLPLSLFILYIGSLTIISCYTAMVTQGMYISGVFLPFVNLLCIVIFYQIIVSYLTSKSITTVIKSLSLVLIITLLYCTLQSFGIDPFMKVNLAVTEWKSGYYMKFKHPAVVGFIGNPTHLSAYLGMCVPLLFIWKPVRAWLSTALLFIVICFCTNWGSKAVPITGIITAVIVLWYYLYKTSKKQFICFVLLSVLLGAVLLFKENTNILFEENSRLAIWKYYLTESKKTFLFGRGLGTILQLSKSSVFSSVSKLHNEFIHFHFEIGLAGLLLILFAIEDFFKLKVKETKQVIILKSVFLGFLIQSLTLYPAHLWFTGATAVLAYSGVYAMKNKENL